MSVDASVESARPLIAHVVFRFDYGGLENGVVNVVNGLPEALFRHAIIALTDASDFQRRTCSASRSSRICPRFSW